MHDKKVLYSVCLSDLAWRLYVLSCIGLKVNFRLLGFAVYEYRRRKNMLYQSDCCNYTIPDVLSDVIFMISVQDVVCVLGQAVCSPSMLTKSVYKPVAAGGLSKKGSSLSAYIINDPIDHVILK